jgi:hypothetical protein
MRNRKPAGNYTRIARLAAAALGIGLASSAHAQEVRGTVSEIGDGGRRSPSAGAFVIVHWTGKRPGIAHYRTVCIQAAVVRTDAQGEFRVAEPPPLRSTFFVWKEEPSVAVYKPGFEERFELRVERPRHALSLVPTRADPARRAQSAEAIAHLGCTDANGMLVPLTDPQGVLPALRAALASEMPLAPSQDRKVKVLRRAEPLPAAP